MRRLLPRVVLVAALSVAAGACSDPTEGKFGAELYDVACARCHASDGSGGALGPAIGPGSTAQLEFSDDDIAGTIRVGPGRMPGFGRRLSEEQIASLVAHVRRLQGEG